jgi:hypothetical protein
LGWGAAWILSRCANIRSASSTDWRQ